MQADRSFYVVRPEKLQEVVHLLQRARHDDAHAQFREFQKENVPLLERAVKWGALAAANDAENAVAASFEHLWDQLCEKRPDGHLKHWAEVRLLNKIRDYAEGVRSYQRHVSYEGDDGRLGSAGLVAATPAATSAEMPRSPLHRDPTFDAAVRDEMIASRRQLIECSETLYDIFWQDFAPWYVDHAHGSADPNGHLTAFWLRHLEWLRTDDEVRGQPSMRKVAMALDHNEGTVQKWVERVAKSATDFWMLKHPGEYDLFVQAFGDECS